MPPKSRSEAAKKADRKYKAGQRKMLHEAQQALKNGNERVSDEQQVALDRHAKRSSTRKAKYRQDKEDRPDFIAKILARNAEGFRARQREKNKIKESGTQSEVEEVNEQQMQENEKKRDAPRHRKWRSETKDRLAAAKELVAKHRGISSQDPESVAALALIQKDRKQKDRNNEREKLRRRVKKPGRDNATRRQLQGDEVSREDPWDSSSDDSTAPGQDDSDVIAVGESVRHPARRASEHEVEHMLGKVRLNFRQSQIYRQSYTRRQPLV